MEKFIENPIVNDNLWDELDELEKQISEADEEFAARADMEYERERERELLRGIL